MQNFFQKFSTSSFLGSFIVRQHGCQDANCAENEKPGEKEATDLDKIFAMEGGMPPDPEEL